MVVVVIAGKAWGSGTRHGTSRALSCNGIGQIRGQHAVCVTRGGGDEELWVFRDGTVVSGSNTASLNRHAQNSGWQHYLLLNSPL